MQMGCWYGGWSVLLCLSDGWEKVLLAEILKEKGAPSWITSHLLWRWPGQSQHTQNKLRKKSDSIFLFGSASFFPVAIMRSMHEIKIPPSVHRCLRHSFRLH